jgi:hypothetical protein
MKLTR